MEIFFIFSEVKVVLIQCVSFFVFIAGSETFTWIVNYALQIFHSGAVFFR